MNAPREPITVQQWPPAQTPLEVFNVLAIMDTLGMVSLALMTMNAHSTLLHAAAMAIVPIRWAHTTAHAMLDFLETGSHATM
jgi:hypothetical protein